MPNGPNCLRGSISYGMPLLRTKTMASSAARSFARGRPAFSWTRRWQQGSYALPKGVGDEFADHTPQSADAPLRSASPALTFVRCCKFGTSSHQTILLTAKGQN